MQQERQSKKALRASLFTHRERREHRGYRAARCGDPFAVTSSLYLMRK